MSAHAASPAAPRRIDIHHHFLPPAYLSAVGEERLAVATAAGKVAAWSVERALELMDLNGIQTAIVSTPSPNYPIGDLERTAALSRFCNELTAQAVRDHPGRFGLFASLMQLPIMDMDRTLKELEYGFDVLAADGVALRSSYQGRYLGDPCFDPLWQELDRRQAVIHVHPAAPDNAGVPGVSASTLEYAFDTTRSIVSLLFNGTQKRFPGVRTIFSHAGGTLPYLTGRVASFSEINPKFVQRGTAGVIPALRSFYYDVTDAVNPYAFGALRSLLPMSQLLFGSDIPFASEPRIAQAANGLGALGLDESEVEAINTGNALKLFPRLLRT